MDITQQVRVFNGLRKETDQVTETPFGRVGNLFNVEGIEALWVSNQAE